MTTSATLLSWLRTYTEHPQVLSIIISYDLKVPVITQVFVIIISVAYLTDAPVFQ